MPQKIIMPKTGMAMEEGTIVRWLKKEGDRITKGEPIAEIETDKVTMELEAEVSGVLLKIVRADGEVVPATGTIAWVGEAGESVSGAEKAAAAAETHAAPSPAPAAPVRVEQPRPAAPAPTLAAKPAPEYPPPAGGRGVPATPAARRMAADAGIALARVPGSGPYGAVRARDVEKAVAAGAAALTGGSHGAPEATLHARVDTTELAAFRDTLNAGGEPGISELDIVVKACALALRTSPLLNATWHGSEPVANESVAVAFASPGDAGAAYPVIRGADTLSLARISRIRAELAAKAASGRIAPEECADATFTVTDLGPYGVSGFTPVIRAPQSAALGIGSAEQAVRVGAAGKVEARRIVVVSLTHDTRRVDTLAAAAFLLRLRTLVQNPHAILA